MCVRKSLLWKPGSWSMKTSSCITPWRNVFNTSSCRRSQPFDTTIESTFRMVEGLIIGANISWTLMPSIWHIPFATKCTLWHVTCPFSSFLSQYTHLQLSTLCSRVWGMRMKQPKWAATKSKLKRGRPGRNWVPGRKIRRSIGAVGRALRGYTSEIEA